MMKISRAFLFAGCCLISACTSQMKGVAPEQLVSTPPVYPYYALANHLDGEVKIRFDVGTNGKVEKMWILTSEPQHLFDDAVISAVAKWRFESNKPYKGMTKTIRFKLNNAG
ncbi:TonB family protein [Raoultella planticola]|uniref:TonB family protein n=1 Tax=Raoultella planticola TaxID=575 RepID=UPI00066D1B07|nr:TonB family protein [Raoultella planticola]TQN56029.1 TonB family protein [Raoultella planticola]HBC8112055.1 TonB family protein [Raoultella planticola]